MRLIQAYEQAISRGDIKNDVNQRQVLVSMQRLVNELSQPTPPWWSLRKKSPVKGIYLYGPVGVGKTYLMDLFYQHAPETKKTRFHFHHFMQQIDVKLRQSQGQKDPLKKIAADLGKTIRLLCFDEFLVHDVAYAMILSELFQALFSNGIVLVATSNTAPDLLYRNGVQRQRFLPVIDLIKTRCELIHLEQKKDYRLGRERFLQTYLYPLNKETHTILEKQFASLTQESKEEGGGLIKIQNREIPFIKSAKRIIWFDFKVLCNLPRSQLDYLELADRFDTFFISEIPALTAKDTVFALLLVHLVDVLYDRGIRLIVSAAVPLEELYIEGEIRVEFKRTLSRLQEMQAQDYLARHPWRHEQDLPES